MEDGEEKKESGPVEPLDPALGKASKDIAPMRVLSELLEEHKDVGALDASLKSLIGSRSPPEETRRRTWGHRYIERRRR